MLDKISPIRLANILTPKLDSVSYVQEKLVPHGNEVLRVKSQEKTQHNVESVQTRVPIDRVTISNKSS